ncbi:MAG: hypothetical protein ACTSVT_04530 [Candidatus Thorarchaeota archaeon]
MSKTVQEKEKKRRKVREKYDPLIRDMEKQISNVEAEVVRLKESLRRKHEAGGKVTKLEVQNVRSLEGTIRPRRLKLQKYYNDKRTEILAIDLDMSVRDLNDQLLDLAEELGMNFENEMERSQILDAFEQRLASTGTVTVSGGYGDEASDEDLAYLGITDESKGSSKSKSSASSKADDDSDLEDDLETLFE